MKLDRQACDELLTHFERLAAGVARAPGRVNIIGEHTDYNDGFVMPIATDLATFTAFAPRDDRTVRAWSSATGEAVEFTLDDLSPRGGGHWSDYLRGVAWSLQDEEGLALRGLDAALVSDVPLGSGLSSSAALEVSWALALLAAAGAELDRRRLALACQRAENDFVGMKCGVMDQLASVLGEEGQAVLLDCWTLRHELVPLPGDEVAVVVMDTGKPRALVDSEYNLRRAQCEEAAQALGVRALRDATMEDLEEAREKLSDVVYRRARHVITENERVFEVAEALEDGDFERAGELINQGHFSLARDYEVSCAELDLICEIARAQDGCYGARLVGAGFGGCAMALVAAGATEEFAKAVKSEYDQRADYISRVLVVTAAEGAGLLELG
ncbi:MAG: galactokinase [Armatimonadetes bacterium]|nr:galactokinase [Armatimonadota bacterium]